MNNYQTTKKIVALTVLIMGATSVNASGAAGGKSSGAYHGGWGIFAGWDTRTPIIGISYNPSHDWEIFGKVGYDELKIGGDKDKFYELALGGKIDIMPINKQSNAYLVGEVLYEYVKVGIEPNDKYKWVKESLWGVALGLGGEYRFTGKQGFQGFYVDVEVGIDYFGGKEKYYKEDPNGNNGGDNEGKYNVTKYGTWTAVLAGYRF